MPEFDLVGGRPSLDFLNTMSGLRVVNPKEKLLVYPDLIAWARQARLQHRRLRAKGPGKFELAFEDDDDWLGFLRPLAVDAAELLTRELPSGRVHRCEERSEEGCGWLFLDETRNHSRRWCSMRDCGNRAKQRRHWQRNRPRTSDLGPQGTRASTAK